MSRELKFRAYVERDETNEFFPGQESYMVTQGEPDVETLQSFMFHYGDEKNIMQSAGLKDKNGKEIFEGDILNFKGELFNIVWIRNACMLSAEPTDKLGRQHFLSPSYFDYAEIIGNIYENPKLLNSDTNVQESDTTEAKSGKQKFWPK